MGTDADNLIKTTIRGAHDAPYFHVKEKTTMNLVEKLLAVDKGEFDKIETKKLKSKQLSKIVGEDAEVTIQAVDGDLFGGLSASGLDEEGEVDYGRAFSTNAKIAAAGIVDPNLKNEELLKHLGVATPADVYAAGIARQRGKKQRNRKSLRRRWLMWAG